jgi:hypothetical protein
MECAYYLGGRHIECAYYFDFGRLCRVAVSLTWVQSRFSGYIYLSGIATKG